MTEITFKQVTTDDLSIISKWLQEPHVVEFWDNSPAHKKDIEIFSHGRTKSSDYFNGCFTYWIASHGNEPYAMLMTSVLEEDDDFPQAWLPYLPEKGYASGIDYMIGNTKFLGKGYGSKTLKLFTVYLLNESNQQCNTFIIDPDINNPRAMHVYEKAGFETKGTFTMDRGYFKGHESTLMVLTYR